MPKLVLKVAESVPKLPPVVLKDKALAVRRVRKMSTGSPNGSDLVAWLVDSSFLEKNSKALSSRALSPGSVLLWNPSGKAPAPGGGPSG